MSQTVPLKKITLKEVCNVKREDDARAYFLAAAKEERELCMIVGEIRGYGSKASQYGESNFLTGFFMAQNRATGKIYKASKAYLPNDITEELIAAFQSRKTEDEIIKFQVTITAVQADTPTGYTFVTEPARTPEAVNRESEMLQTFLAVPAPAEQKKLASKK